MVWCKVRTILPFWLLAAGCWLIPFSSHATLLEHGVSKAVEEENQTAFVELYRIRVENKLQGSVEVSEDDGWGWTEAGKVLVPVSKVNEKGFTASGWAKIGTVAATAVNAIHIKVAHNAQLNVGVIFSLLPKEFYNPPAKGYKSYFAASASLVTNIRAGKSIFGGGYAPFVGNKVYLESEKPGQDETLKNMRESEDGKLVPGFLSGLPEGYVPKEGDTFVIFVERPEPYPSEIVFENRFGGQIFLFYPDGTSKIIGEVLKPVVGTGRFEGGVYAYKGRIRANHCGVIDIATAGYGIIGGFQIIPANHGMSPEMLNARLLTQWMIVGPLSVTEPDFSGVAPLFSFYLKPDYDADDVYKEDWYDRILSRTLVLVKIGTGDWQLPPEVSGRKDDGLKNITAIKIILPVFAKDEEHEP